LRHRLRQCCIAAGDTQLLAVDSDLGDEHPEILLGERLVAEQRSAQNARERVNFLRPDGL
jgi:hypothetical protein